MADPSVFEDACTVIQENLMHVQMSVSKGTNRRWTFLIAHGPGGPVKNHKTCYGSGSFFTIYSSEEGHLLRSDAVEELTTLLKKLYPEPEKTAESTEAHLKWKQYFDKIKDGFARKDIVRTCDFSVSIEHMEIKTKNQARIVAPKAKRFGTGTLRKSSNNWTKKGFEKS